MFKFTQNLLLLTCCIGLVSIAFSQEETQSSEELTITDAAITEKSISSQESESTTLKTGFTQSSLEFDTTSSDIDDKNDSAEVDELQFNDDEFGILPNTNQAIKPSRFDELTLPDFITKNIDLFEKRSDDFQSDKQHVYKVPKNKPKKSFRSVDGKSDFGSQQLTKEKLVNVANKTYFYKYHSQFQLFTSLYDHNFWNFEDFSGNVSKKCSADMEVYLDGLKSGKLWALKGKNSKKVSEKRF